MFYVNVGCGRTGHGGHRPTIVSKAILSPLQRGGESRAPRGAGVGLLYIYAVFQYASNHNLKAWVSGCETKGFRV